MAKFTNIFEIRKRRLAIFESFNTRHRKMTEANTRTKYRELGQKISRAHYYIVYDDKINILQPAAPILDSPFYPVAE